jgi:homoserine dehydrogenase
MSVRRIKIGLLGFGTVGRSFVELIERNRERLREREGLDLAVDRALVRDPGKHRPLDEFAARPGVRLTTNPREVLDNGADVVVEALGGTEPARSYVLSALESGKHVVTANKKLLAAHHDELARLAAERGVRLGIEASVGAGVPWIRALRDGLRGDRVDSLCGIVNGTCNYVLTQMNERGSSLEAALAEAQAKGFAEADPSTDIDGVDAAEKIAILATLAFGRPVPVSDVPVRGIRGLDAEDMRTARRMKVTIRLVAWAQPLEDGSLWIQVGPVMLPQSHPFATVRNEQNALLIRGEACGPLLLQGNGAGGGPTASAVLGDVVDAVREGGSRAVAPVARPPAAVAPPCGEGAYYVRMPVAPGARLVDHVNGILRGCEVEARLFTVQRPVDRPGVIDVVLVTRSCPWSSVQALVGAVGAASAPVILPIWEDSGPQAGVRPAVPPVHASATPTTRPEQRKRSAPSPESATDDEDVHLGTTATVATSA